jgi:hypothetical protein
MPSGDLALRVERRPGPGHQRRGRRANRVDTSNWLDTARYPFSCRSFMNDRCADEGLTGGLQGLQAGLIPRAVRRAVRERGDPGWPKRLHRLVAPALPRDTAEADQRMHLACDRAWARRRLRDGTCSSRMIMRYQAKSLVRAHTSNRAQTPARLRCLRPCLAPLSPYGAQSPNRSERHLREGLV